ncbi:MAG: hypothetical protein ACREBD_02505 [Blastocatellia bacterium]
MPDFNRNIFINCPFDSDYLPLLHAIVFSSLACGFTPRCALEDDDSGELRILKILRIIKECRFGIHDLSRTEANPITQLPRFNMPFELGLDFAHRYTSKGPHRNKRLLILDREMFRYQSFVSDLAGLDIKAHQNDPHKLIQLINDWLRSQSGVLDIPGAAAVFQLFTRFQTRLPRLAAQRGHNPYQLSFTVLTLITREWLEGSVKQR